MKFKVILLAINVPNDTTRQDRLIPRQVTPFLNSPPPRPFLLYGALLMANTRRGGISYGNETMRESD